MVAGLLSLARAVADQPLSQDDITLLLLGSSPSSKIIQMVEKRGVDFQMNPDLAKKFHDQGAKDDLIDALQKAGNKAAAAKVSAPAPAAADAPAPASASPAVPEAAPQPAPAPSAESNSNTPASPAPSLRRKPNAVGASEPRAAEAPPAAPTTAEAPSSSEPVLHTRQASAPVAIPAASAPSPAPASTGGGSSSEPVLHESKKKDDSPETPAVASAPGLKDPDRTRSPTHHSGICRQGEGLSRGPQQLHLPPDQQG